MQVQQVYVMMIASETAGKHHKHDLLLGEEKAKQSPEQSKHTLSGDKPVAIHVSCAPFKSPTTIYNDKNITVSYSITVQVLDEFHCKICRFTRWLGYVDFRNSISFDQWPWLCTRHTWPKVPRTWWHWERPWPQHRASLVHFYTDVHIHL